MSQPRSTSFESMRQRIANDPNGIALSAPDGEQLTNKQLFTQIASQGFSRRRTMDLAVLCIFFVVLYFVLKFEYNFDMLHALYNALIAALNPGRPPPPPPHNAPRQ